MSVAVRTVSQRGDAHRSQRRSPSSQRGGDAQRQTASAGVSAVWRRSVWFAPCDFVPSDLATEAAMRRARTDMEDGWMEEWMEE